MNTCFRKAEIQFMSCEGKISFNLNPKPGCKTARLRNGRVVKANE